MTTNSCRRATSHTTSTSRMTRSLVRLSFLNPLVIHPPPAVTESAPSPTPPIFAKFTYACEGVHEVPPRIVEEPNAATSSHRTTLHPDMGVTLHANRPDMSVTLHANIQGSAHASGVRPSPKRSSTLNALPIPKESTGEVPKSSPHLNHGIWRPGGRRKPMTHPRHHPHHHPRHRPRHRPRRRRQLLPQSNHLILAKPLSKPHGRYSWKNLSPMISTTESMLLSSTSASIGSRTTRSPRRRLRYIPNVPPSFSGWVSCLRCPTAPFLSPIHILTGYEHGIASRNLKAVEGGTVIWWLVSASALCKSPHHADFWQR